MLILVKDFRSENGLYSLIQAQYDAAMQNPPWESRDEFDIDDRPKKKRRVKERWYFEVVYPEGMGPEDFEDPDETDEDQTQQLFDSQLEGTDDDGSKMNHSSSAAEDLPTQPRVCLGKRANDNTVEDSPATMPPPDKPRLRTRSSRSQSRIGSSPQPPAHPDEDAENLDSITLVPQTSEPEEKLTSFSSRSIVASAPAPLTASTSSATASSTSSRHDIFSTSSPLSSLPSSPVLPSGSQLKPLPNQAEFTSEDSSLLESDPYSSANTSYTRDRTLQRDDSRSKYSQSDDERTNFESSQSSTRPLRNFKGRDLFDSIIWADAYSTSIFYMFITSFRQKVFNDVKTTSPTHKFIRMLRDSGRLVRNYTQNIDSLEEREGLATDLSLGPGSRSRFSSKTQRERRPSDVPGDNPHSTGVECVQLHGSLVSLRCGLCAKLSRWDEADRESITLSGQAPDCPSCTEYNARRTGRGRRGLAVGRLRPDIVLYGEEHPSAHLVAPLITHDLGLGPDVLLIMGTSLKVHGLKIMVKEFAKAVHTKGGKVIFVNRTKPPESTWGEVIDYWVECDCDAWVLDLEDRRADISLPQGIVEEPKKKRELSRENTGDTTQKPDEKKISRPQATRDDRMNGAYHTFKMLDLLWNLKDDRGQPAGRPTYWQKAPRASIGNAMDVQQGRKVSKARAPRKENNNTTKAAKRRKTYPSCMPDDNRDVDRIAYLEKQWDQLRVKAPGLPARIPESVIRSGRVVLAEVEANLPSFLQPFKFTFNPGAYAKGTSSHIPNLKGLSLPPQMSLVSHPPSGATLPLHSPTGEDAEKIAHHSYGTRKSHRFSSASTFVAESECTAEDTIVVAPPPLTPKSKRIKRMGSIGTILSSSPEIYHDVEERPDDADSGTSQEFHDAIEWRTAVGA